MIPINYEINSNQIGSGNVAKVYKIREINSPLSILIAKIFDQSKIRQYEQERKILLKLSEQNNNEVDEKDYFIKLKNIELRLQYSDAYLFNSKLLIFDYLNHDRLCEYLYQMPNISHIKESHIKLLCYKLLLGLKKCHEKNICHNKIDLKNIMFDNDFNPVLIHFSEASMDIQNNNFNKDFKGLGTVLAKIITLGKFKTITSNKIGKNYYIKTNGAISQKNTMEESSFWKTIKLIHNIKISDEFINFFGMLVKTENILNVDDLLNDVWLKEIKDNLSEIDQDFKKEFKNIYSMIEDSQKMNTFKIDDLSSILNSPKKEKSIFNELKNDDELYELENGYNIGKRVIVKECYKEKNDSDSGGISPKGGRKKKKASRSRDKGKKKFDDNSSEKECSEEKYNYENLLKKNENGIWEINNKINPCKDFEKNQGEEYLTLEDKDIDIQTIQYQPKGIQFNYIEINIKGSDYSCKKTLNKYIKNLQTNIKKFNYKKYLNIVTKNLTNNCGFNLTFEEFEIDKEYNDEELVYLNEDDAENNLMVLTMKVELFKLEQPKYATNNKYYLMFNHVQGDMADYYEYLKIIKILSTSQLSY